MNIHATKESTCHMTKKHTILTHLVAFHSWSWLRKQTRQRISGSEERVNNMKTKWPNIDAGAQIKFYILIQRLFKFILKVPRNDTSALVQVMAWQQTINWSNGDTVDWCVLASSDFNQLTLTSEQALLLKARTFQTLFHQLTCVYFDTKPTTHIHPLTTENAWRHYQELASIVAAMSWGYSARPSASTSQTLMLR